MSEEEAPPREADRAAAADRPGAADPAASADPAAAGGLREFYARGYATADPDEAARLGRWRALGAAVKAGHVQVLLSRAGVRPATVVEIGCGDGALLEELGRRGVAPALDGFELSPTAAAMAAQRPIPGARRVEAYDGERIPAGDRDYDLAVVSHVLEHVPDPAALLGEAARVAKHVVVEVPLEDNRSAARAGRRAEARRIGHIQYFSRADIRGLAAGADLTVTAELTDPLPYAHHAFFADTLATRSRAAAVFALRHAVWRASPRRAERLFTLHYAALLAHGRASRAPSPAG